MTTDSKDILTHFLQEVWTEGNVEAADRYVATSYSIHHDPGDPWDGQTLDLDGFKDRVRKSRGPFPDQCFTTNEMIAEDGRVAVTWSWKGTHKGDITGFPASGKVISMSGMTIYYFDGERLTGHWQLVDRLGVYQQLSG